MRHFTRDLAFFSMHWHCHDNAASFLETLPLGSDQVGSVELSIDYWQQSFDSSTVTFVNKTWNGV